MEEKNLNPTPLLKGRLPRGWLVWIFLIVVLAVALHFWGLANGLPAVTDPDENTMIRRALRCGGGDLNPHFFYYPSFSIYLFAVVSGAYFLLASYLGIFHSVQDFALQFINNPTTVYVLCRSVIALSDCVTPVLLFCLGARWADKSAGLIAALLWVVAPLPLERAQIAKPDSLMVMLYILATVVIYRTVSRRGLVWGGLLVGLSISSKYLSGILLPGLGAAIFFRSLSWESRFRDGIVFLLAVGLGFLIGTPYALLSFSEFWSHFREQFLIMFAGQTGLEHQKQGWGIYLPMLAAPLKSPAVGFLAGIGTIFSLIRRDRVGIVALLSIAPLILLIGSFRIYNEHYFLLALPFIFLLAAYGASILSRVRPQGRWLSAFFVLWAFVPYAHQTWNHLGLVSRPDTRLLAKAWIEQNIPQGSHLLLDASGPVLSSSRPQLQELLRRAEETGHIKKDLFRLQLMANHGEGYYLYLTEHPIMATPPQLLEYSRKVQALMPMDRGIDWLRHEGIQYVVTSSNEALNLQESAARRLYPKQADFYRQLEQGATLLKEFSVKELRCPGVTLRIYQL